MSLHREQAYYTSHKEAFLEHEGKFVAIHGEEVAGFWETYEDALQVACDRFGLEPFMIKKIEAVEPVHYIRGLPVCPSGMPRSRKTDPRTNFEASSVHGSARPD